MQSIKETCPKKKVSKAEIDLIVNPYNGSTRDCKCTTILLPEELRGN